MLKAGGTVEEYEAKADSVKAILRQELQCFSPACELIVTVKAGSVILTVVATDTAGQVESAALALQTKPPNAMSSVLGITIEEAPGALSVIDVQIQVMRLAPSPPPPFPPPPTPTLPPWVPPGANDLDVAMAIGLSLGSCLLVAVLAAAAYAWYRTRRMQTPPPSSSTRAPQQIEVIVTHSELKQAGAPQSLAALLAACGLQHREKIFLDEGYTLDQLLGAMKQGEAVAKSDLRELKLTLGECRKILSQLSDVPVESQPLSF